MPSQRTREYKTHYEKISLISWWETVSVMLMNDKLTPFVPFTHLVPKKMPTTYRGVKVEWNT